MQEENPKEPYEVMPDGHPYAATDWLVSLLASTALIISLVALMWTEESQAAGQNWCGEYRDGYQIGYCWTRRDCSYIPPRMCPYPEDDQDDGFMVGLKEGLAEGRVDQ